MEIRVLGCYGSRLPGFNTTSFLLNGNCLVDAGTVASVLSVEEQSVIDHVLITHAHMDHIAELMFLADNMGLTAQRTKPIQVAGTAGIIDALKKHLFNGVIWPDFSSLPDLNHPIMTFKVLSLEEKHNYGNYVVTPFSVNHSVDAIGYLIEFDDGRSAIFAGDTGPTDRLWEIAKTQKNLKAIFIETSFPNNLQDVADRTHHLTPARLEAELNKLGEQTADIYLFHMKTVFDIERIRKDVGGIKGRKIGILKDGDIININR